MISLQNQETVEQKMLNPKVKSINAKIATLQKQLEQLRAECEHVWPSIFAGSRCKKCGSALGHKGVSKIQSNCEHDYEYVYTPEYDGGDGPGSYHSASAHDCCRKCNYTVSRQIGSYRYPPGPRHGLRTS